MTSDASAAAADQIELGPDGLTAGEVVAVVRRGAAVRLGSRGRAAMAASAAVVDRLVASDVPTYGISTGFGALATTFIDADRRADLQRSLVRSHAAGMGAPVENEVVRALVLLRARSLAMGCSGARPEVAEALLALLRAGITPVVPEHGSLGCSGDLAPLSHVALVLIGEGEAFLGDDRTNPVPGAVALARAGLAPVELRAKEGLALVNGTDGMLGMLVLAAVDLARLLATADVTAALTCEALLGTDRAYAADLIALRPHPGQVASAANLTRLLDGSPLMASHRADDHRVQDAYSVRCTPQVHGAARDALAWVEQLIERELRAAVDNPIVLADGRIESCGNFHGAPLALAADTLAVAVASAASIAERRTDRLLDVARSHGLPPFLAHEPGVDSGLMIAQYTAAGLVAELKRLAVPASVDSIPSSAMQEDHVSMGWAACRKLRRSVEAYGQVLGIEAVTAARAIDLRAPLQPAAATGAALRALRDVVPGPGPDRWLAPDLAAAAQLVSGGSLLDATEAAAGPLP